MIFKDKEINQKIEHLYAMVIALARIQKIHPEILKKEALNFKENAKYMMEVALNEKKDSNTK